MEFPMEFFLTFARDPQHLPKEKLGEFTTQWATREFGPTYASEIAKIMEEYAKYNGRRKPELLEPGTYSQLDYEEADRVAAEFQSVVNQAEEIYGKLPENYGDAFFQLVLFPVKASAQVTQLYITAGKNQLYAKQGRASANDLAAQARTLFQADAALSANYNHTMAHGKWDHMMDQAHIGYTFWNEPPKNTMPEVVELNVPADGKMGIAIEGSSSAWPGAAEEAVLPQFDSFGRQRYYVDVFNRGRAPFRFSVTATEPWIRLSQSSGDVEKEQRVWVSIDWSKAPAGTAAGSVNISAAGAEPLIVKVGAFNPKEPTRDTLRGFVESGGVVAMEADEFTRKVDAGSVRWEKIPDYGRTASGMSTFPVTAASVEPPRDSPCLEYQMYLFDPGNVEVEAILGPTLNFVPGRGLRYAVSFDDQKPQIIDALAQNSLQDWETSVKDNVRKSTSKHSVPGTGYHTLKLWMVDPGVVVEKIVVNLGGVCPSYLGPVESYRGGRASGKNQR
jgi:hypothetical protein